MTTVPLRLTVLCLLVLPLAMLSGGCRSASTPAPITIEAGSYERAFDATRGVLTDARFKLERVDARAGVITTQAKPTVGLFTPWDAEQSTLGQEWEDATNQQERVIRVTFAPASAADHAADPAAPILDLRDAATPLVARVEVLVYRVRWPGWRPETESIRRSTRSSDPLQRTRGVYPGQRSEVGHDTKLADRVSRRISKRLAASPATRSGSPAAASPPQARSSIPTHEAPASHAQPSPTGDRPSDVEVR